MVLDDYVVLTDIAGVEDHLGDMDFKVAGTSEGITALQMDIKITGVTFEIMSDALSQAKEGREFILGKMHEAIEAPREQLSEHAPRISSIQIDPEKIGLLIGKGGETIRSLQEEYESQIDVNDEGQVLVYASNGSWATRSPRPRSAARTSWARWPRPSRARARSSPRTLRASARSRSTPTRSA